MMSVADREDESVVRKLAELVDEIRAGKVPAAVVDQTTAERWLLRLFVVFWSLLEQHRLDKKGRCLICRQPHRRWWWPWPTRTTCTVHSAAQHYLDQPDWTMLSIIAGGYRTPQDAP